MGGGLGSDKHPAGTVQRARCRMTSSYPEGRSSQSSVRGPRDYPTSRSGATAELVKVNEAADRTLNFLLGFACATFLLLDLLLLASLIGAHRAPPGVRYSRAAF